MSTYFSEKEFSALRAELAGLAAVKWLALAGKPLTVSEAEKLDAVLERFFRVTGHRSFQEHHSAEPRR